MSRILAISLLYTVEAAGLQQELWPGDLKLVEGDARAHFGPESDSAGILDIGHFHSQRQLSIQNGGHAFRRKNNPQLVPSHGADDGLLGAFHFPAAILDAV